MLRKGFRVERGAFNLTFGKLFRQRTGRTAMVAKSRSLIRRRGLNQPAGFEAHNLNESPVVEEVLQLDFMIRRTTFTDPGLRIQTTLQVTQLSTPLAASVPNFFTSSCYTTTSGPLSSPSSPSMSITHIEWNIKLKTD